MKVFLLNPSDDLVYLIVTYTNPNPKHCMPQAKVNTKLNSPEL